MTLVAEQATMATTQLMRAAYCEVCWPLQKWPQAEVKRPRMNWVVVTDENNHRQLRACWRADRE